MPKTAFVVPYHQQNSHKFCGPACAQMVLASIGQDLLDQKLLFESSKVQPLLDGDWSTAPDGLLREMNLRRPPGFAFSFPLHLCQSKEELSQLLCATIETTEVAPIVLMNRDQHWLVVTGFDLNGPRPHAGAAYDIRAFYVSNPLPEVPRPLRPLVHAAGDGCGSGDAERGLPNHQVMLEVWHEFYLREPVRKEGCWNGYYLAVCAGDPAAPLGGCRVWTGAPGEPAPPPAETDDIEPRPVQAREILPPELAAERAIREFDAYGFAADSPWTVARHESVPGEPVLVEPFERDDDAYYLIPLVTDDHRVPLLVIADAYTGAYQESAAMPGQTTHPLDMLDPERRNRRLAGNELTLEDTNETVKLVEQTDVTRLVWQPSRESLSRLWPFYLATADNGKDVYVRVDGAAFDTLNTDDHGL